MNYMRNYFSNNFRGNFKWGDIWQERLVALLLVGAICFTQARHVWPALHIPWWFNTDEIFYLSEVARFLGGDFNQTYFDIPGTPLMTITAVILWGGWFLAHLFGFTQLLTHYDFAFGNLQGIVTLMRFETLVFSLCAVLVSFYAIRRAANLIVATGASILVISLPIFIQYSQFVRSESLGLLCCFGAWLLLQKSDENNRGEAYLWAGLLCGVAMAARFHFALVGPPLLLMHWLSSSEYQEQHMGSAWPVRIWTGLLFFFVMGGFFVLLIRLDWIAPSWFSDALLVTACDAQGHRVAGVLAPNDVLKATGTIAKLWYLLATGAFALLLMRRVPAADLWTDRLFRPVPCYALLGFAFGFLLSHPAFLWQGYHQLKSIAFYSAWDDAELSRISLPAAWVKVTAYYFTTSLPERWLQVLFAFGIVCVLYRKIKSYLPLVALVAVCFLAHPPRMKLWPHHIIPWLPALCAIAMLPLGIPWEYIKSRRVHWIWGTGFVGLFGVGLIALVQPRTAQASSYYEISRDRVQFITELDDWLIRSIQPTDTLFISYYAMNSDCFYLWIESRGVKVPEFVTRNRQAQVWWLNKEVLRGKKGYLAVSPADISFFYDDFERKEPGKQINPFKDSRFVEQASFGAGFYEIMVFYFDFTQSES